MKIKGVTDDEMNILVSILSLYPSCEFFAYGARVKGNFRPLSDLDILIKGDFDIGDVEAIKEKFDESDLSYVVNIAARNAISDRFYKMIEPDLVKLL